MKKILLVLVIISQTALAYAANCRDAIVEAQASLGNQIERNSFSSSTFLDFNISVEEFNLLEPSEQEEIYAKIRPIEVMIEKSIDELNQKIQYVSGSFYEMMMLDELTAWRTSRDELRSCEIE